MKEFQKIKSRIIQNNLTIVDDIINKPIRIYGIVLLSNGKCAGLFDISCYSFKELYIDQNNLVHLSKKYTGGAIFHNDIDRYNDSCDIKILEYYIF